MGDVTVTWREYRLDELGGVKLIIRSSSPAGPLFDACVRYDFIFSFLNSHFFHHGYEQSRGASKSQISLKLS